MTLMQSLHLDRFSVADFIARMKSASTVSEGQLAQRIEDYENYMKQLETMGKWFSMKSNHMSTNTVPLVWAA